MYVEPVDQTGWTMVNITGGCACLSRYNSLLMHFCEVLDVDDTMIDDKLQV